MGLSQGQSQPWEAQPRAAFRVGRGCRSLQKEGRRERRDIERGF